MIFVLFFHRHRHEEATPQGTRLKAGQKTRQKPAPQYTLALGGGDAGLYWSGAMRCPKCRADMEQVDYESRLPCLFAAGFRALSFGLVLMVVSVKQENDDHCDNYCAEYCC